MKKSFYFSVYVDDVDRSIILSLQWLYVFLKVCFNGDSTKVLTVSGDKTAKIWDVENATVIRSVSNLLDTPFIFPLE